MTLPFRERGYAIDIPALVVHERYAEHARGLPRTTPRGVENIAAGREITPCHLCFGPPPSEDRSSRRRKAPLPDERDDPETALSAEGDDVTATPRELAHLLSGPGEEPEAGSSPEDRPE